MKRFAFLFVILASAGFTVFGHVANMQEPMHARAQDTKKSPGEIRFPSAPIEVIPLPKPTPGAVLTLALDSLYVIDADIPILLFDSPVGMVKWTKEAGPLKIRARFVGEEGVKTKTFAGKYIYSVEAKKTGAVELIVVPVGATEESAAIRRVLDVDAGEGPRPPPKPPVPPGPTPTPVVLNEFGKLVLMHAEKINTPAIAKAMGNNYLPVIASMRADGMTVESAVKELFTKNRESLGGDAAKWSGFFTWLDNELTRRAEKGLLPSVAAHADYFEQIGAALRKAGE